MFLLEEASLNNVKAFFADVINTALLLINHHAHFRGVTSYLGVRVSKISMETVMFFIFLW